MFPDGIQVCQLIFAALSEIMTHVFIWASAYKVTGIVRKECLTLSIHTVRFHGRLAFRERPRNRCPAGFLPSAEGLFRTMTTGCSSIQSARGEWTVSADRPVF